MNSAFQDNIPAEQTRPHRRMSTRNRLLFFLTAWLIVLMPFVFWWNTWFGRQLSDKQLSEYLRDDKKPRHIQHALVQIGERLTKHDTRVTRWYPEVIRLASALSLVRFGDATGRPQILALLQPAEVKALQSGKVIDTSTVGTAIHQGGVVAKLEQNGQTIEIRSPIAGRLRNLFVKTGQPVTAGDEIATLDPSIEQVWEALRALYLVGRLDDLPAILPYERELPDIPDHVRQQALLTEKAIRERK